MTRLKNWFQTIFLNHDHRRNVTVAVLLLFATIGFTDATYLTIGHFTGSTLRCGLSGSCNTVVTSEYAKIFGIPVALLGSLYYATVIFLCIGYFDTKKPYTVTILKRLPLAGLFASLYFVALQLFVLHAICLYCMVSAGTSTAIFITSLFLKKA